MDTLAEIQERHDAVRDLEKKLLDLQQVCFDFINLLHRMNEKLWAEFDAIYLIKLFVFVIMERFPFVADFLGHGSFGWYTRRNAWQHRISCKWGHTVNMKTL